MPPDRRIKIRYTDVLIPLYRKSQENPNGLHRDDLRSLPRGCTARER